MFRKEKKNVQIVSFATTPKQTPLFWLPRGSQKGPFLGCQKKCYARAQKIYLLTKIATLSHETPVFLLPTGSLLAVLPFNAPSWDPAFVLKGGGVPPPSETAIGATPLERSAC